MAVQFNAVVLYYWWGGAALMAAIGALARRRFGALGKICWGRLRQPLASGCSSNCRNRSVLLYKRY